MDSTLLWIIAFLFFLLPLIYILIRLSLWSKNDIIETHETVVRVAVCIVPMILFFILLAGGGISIIVYYFTAYSWRGAIVSPLGAILIFPLFYALLSYMWLPVLLREIL
jgi:hypothetical protein